MMTFRLCFYRPPTTARRWATAILERVPEGTPGIYEHQGAPGDFWQFQCWPDTAHVMVSRGTRLRIDQGKQWLVDEKIILDKEFVTGDEAVAFFLEALRDPATLVIVHEHL